MSRLPLDEWKAKCVQKDFPWHIIEDQLRSWEPFDADELENIGVTDGGM